MRQINLFLASMALLLISSCAKDNNTTPPTITITLSTTSITLSTADTTSISATISPITYADELVWTSSNNQIAAINSDGLVTAMSGGTTSIKATVGENSVECTVTINAAVYAVGTINNSSNAPIGLLWKDGVVVDTVSTASDYGYLQGVALDDNNNIYLAGYTSASGSSVPFSWKNGFSTSLQSVGTSGYPTSLGIFNNNLYISGIINSGQENMAAIWINNAATTLTDGTQTAYASSLFVYSDTTYIVGYIDSTSVAQRAVLWVDNVATYLSDGTSNAAALDIFIVDGTTYICGYDGEDAVIWKNGVKEVISTTEYGAKALAIYVTASAHVYTVGYAQNSSYTQMATLWKNGVAEQLHNTAAVASDVYVNGSDVYVSGKIYGVTTPATTAALWKNGTYTPYSDGTTNGDISSIFVK